MDVIAVFLQTLLGFLLRLLELFVGFLIQVLTLILDLARNIVGIVR